VELSPDAQRALEEQMVLFYTGLPRLAKNVLQRVVDRYLARDPETIEILDRMPILAREVADGLRAGDMRMVGDAFSKTWEWHKKLEPSSSNPDIDRVFEAAEPYVWGARLVGAGGGGFMVIIARSREDAAELRELLPRVQPTGEIHEARVATQGLELVLQPA
jgi:fucokinase